MSRETTGSSALDRIVDANSAMRVWTVVLDDDPTGTQSIAGLPVLTPGFTDTDLQWAAEQQSLTTFVLTNSRSVGADTAEMLTTDVIGRASSVARQKGLTLRLISRSDSTLRGHFATEVAAAHRALRAAGTPAHGTVFVPAFIEAGRVTIDDVQWVRSGAGFVPAARTEFAKDATFGYTEDNLLDWVQGRMDAAAPRAVSIGIPELRSQDGVSRVSARIAELHPEGVLVANAADARDLEVLMLGLLEQERAGRRPVIRSGPSFVRLCAGQHPADPLASDAIDVRNTGLVVIGSHTALTNAQFAAAYREHDLHLVELDAAAVVTDENASSAAEVSRCVREISSALESGDVVIRTSRTVLTSGRTTPLLTSNAIADALVEVVSRVVGRRRPGFLIAKGGITSSDMAVRALATRRALVLGQMLPGTIPIWKLLDGISPGLPYVVFPGNVGAENALSAVLAKLRGATPERGTQSERLPAGGDGVLVDDPRTTGLP